MPDILHRISIQAAPERVYQALATVDGIRGWWTRDADLEPQTGGRGEFRFSGGPCGSVATQVRVDALEPAARVAWTVLQSGAPGGWEGTTIAFDLRADGDGTVLSFAHRGFAQESDGMATCSTGWALYLMSLQQFVETGRGVPHPESHLRRVPGGPAIVHELDIAATPDRLYQALTTSAGLAGWWTPEASAAEAVGGLNELRFGSMALRFRVDALDSGRHVAWTGVDVPPD